VTGASFVNTLTLADGVAGASQSCLAPAYLASASVRELAALGAGYLRFLDRLPLLRLRDLPGIGATIGLCWPRLLPLLRFSTPYLAAARGGRELRYPLAGGLMLRSPGGWLAFGIAPEGASTRLWIDVVGYAPRLGLATLYLLTQVQLHRLITTAYLRQVLRELQVGVDKALSS